MSHFFYLINILSINSINRKIGYYGVFGIALAMSLSSFFYGIFIVKDLEKSDEQKKVNYPEKSFLADFFDKEHLVETFRVTFKKGHNQRRMRVIMLMSAVSVFKLYNLWKSVKNSNFLHF